MTMCSNILNRENAACRASPRTGVTLIELLVVVAIIAVIAAVSIGALMVIPEHARTKGTESLIAKINGKLVQRLDQFNSRRETITTLSSVDLPLAANEPSLARVIATVRTMRQTFPEWFEILPARASDGFDNDGDGQVDETVNVDTNGDGTPDTAVCDEIVAGQWNPLDIGGTVAPEQTGIDLPAAAKAHLKFVQRVFADTTLRPSGEGFMLFEARHQPETARAECLYMIVTAGGTETSEFAPNEIGDTDEDGLPEFVDKWKRPILFFLWPTNYTSPRQKPGSETNPDDPNQLLTEWNPNPPGDDTGWWGETSPRNTRPLRLLFESLYFSLSDPSDPLNKPKAYRTYPLIVSAGGDGGFGLQTPGPLGNGTMGDMDDVGTIGVTVYKRAERIANSSLDGYAMDHDNVDNHGLKVK
jgi:prepilin-type N-terminal cleavage/methylation domain-containing protein